ncbi:MAG: acid phosphatase, partial [Alphaproteobacteria bacterium]|nr:acid phosphatase [Alphaproteobacteria bacterium]
IKHIIVISLENHSFDNLFGNFPGAEGIAQAGDTVVQTDKNGVLYATLPPVMVEENGRRVSDIRFPPDLPNHPFPIDAYVPATQKTGDLVHRFYQQQEQINGGRMDRFAAVSDAGGLVMGYYDGSKTALWEYAKKYTLADRFFHAAFGGSFLNHFWMVCACTPRFDNAPAEMVATLDSAGKLVKDGAVTPDGYAVNTVFASATPHPEDVNVAHLLPPQEMPTIGDRLSEKGVSWAWYAGGWNDALAGKPHESFQFHHQPFAYFRNYADGAPARAKHLKDEVDFLYALKDGSLPAVSFYKPLGEYNLHPGYATVASGDARLGTMLKAIEQSPVWQSSVIIVTFDENGGYWDHMPPPAGDRWGPAMRVPTLIISPFAKKGHVDHTVYDTTSILKLIEERFGLAPLGERDAKANSLAAALAAE